MAYETPTPDFLKMAEELLKELPAQVAEQALRHFNMSFEKQGFTDTSFIPWVKRADDLTFGTNHPLLDKSGELSNSLAILSQTMQRIEIGTTGNIPYAGIHNSGGTIQVKVTPKMRRYFWFIYHSLTKGYAHGSEPPDHILKWKHMALTRKQHLTIRIPQRQFIGRSEQLLKDIDELAIKTILNKFKSLENG